MRSSNEMVTFTLRPPNMLWPDSFFLLRLLTWDGSNDRDHGIPGGFLRHDALVFYENVFKVRFKDKKVEQ